MRLDILARKFAINGAVVKATPYVSKGNPSGETKITFIAVHAPAKHYQVLKHRLETRFVGKCLKEWIEYPQPRIVHTSTPDGAQGNRFEQQIRQMQKAQAFSLDGAAHGGKPRIVGMHPAFGMPYSGDPYASMAKQFEGTAFKSAVGGNDLLPRKKPIKSDYLTKSDFQRFIEKQQRHIAQGLGIPADLLIDLEPGNRVRYIDKTPPAFLDSPKADQLGRVIRVRNDGKIRVRFDGFERDHIVARTSLCRTKDEMVRDQMISRSARVAETLLAQRVTEVLRHFVVETGQVIPLDGVTIRLTDSDSIDAVVTIRHRKA